MDTPSVGLLRIVVPVKQVPQVATLRFDLERRQTVREDVPLVLNAYDRRALGEALRLRARLGGEVVVVTLGPPQARKVLEECLALGADRAIHLCDPAFAGGDTLATVRALAAEVRPLAPDLVLCGQRSVDAETSQVGPALAELLDLPQVTAAVRVVPEDSGRALHVERLTDEGREVLRVGLPCLLTAAERLHRPEAGDPPPVPGSASIETRSAADLGLAPGQIGEAGSLTWVRGMRLVEAPRRREMLEGPTEAMVERLLVVIGEANDKSQAIGTHSPLELSATGTHSPLELSATGTHSPLEPSPRPQPSPSGRGSLRPLPLGEGWGRGEGSSPQQSHKSNDVLVFAERTPGFGQLDGRVSITTRLLLQLAARLAPRPGGRVLALLAGSGAGDENRDVTAMVEAGAERVLWADHPTLATYSTEPYAWLLARMIRQRRPALVLLAATAIGRDLASRVAARLGLGLVSDCEDVRLEPDRRLTFVRPSLGGRVLADVETRAGPALATVRPGALRRLWGVSSQPASVFAAGPGPGGMDSWIDAVDVAELPTSRAIVLEAHRDISRFGSDVETARIVIGVGSGLGGSEHLPAIECLAHALGGTIGATRKVVDLGWLPPQQQIGLSGRQISPRLYLAIGVRGSFNHAIGIRRAETVIAINKDPRAEIFGECDLGIVGDWGEIVPTLTERVALGARASRPLTRAGGTPALPAILATRGFDEDW